MSSQRFITQSNSKIKVELTDKIRYRILALCLVHPNMEWSGVLFYSNAGDVITLEDLLFMDSGSAGYTEYETDVAVVKYMMKINFLEKGWKMGHIHSHHNMAVFFSGTDMDEIYTNAPNHKEYLSVIVNNKFDIAGKLSTAQDVEIKFFNKSGNDMGFTPSPATYYNITDCDIKMIEEDFAARYVAVIAEKDRIAKEKASKTTVLKGYEPPKNSGKKGSSFVGQAGFDFGGNDYDFSDREYDDGRWGRYDKNYEDKQKKAESLSLKLQKFLVKLILLDPTAKFTVKEAITKAVALLKKTRGGSEVYLNNLQRNLDTIFYNVFGKEEFGNEKLWKDIWKFTQDELYEYEEKFPIFCETIYKVFTEETTVKK
jgi:hypothetical protein